MGNEFELNRCVLISIVITQIVLSQGFVFVQGRTTPLKTIESDDGEVIDCVDIYKQPAFDHPLLQNHTIQMRPSSYPNGMEENDFITSVELQQTWHNSGRCPEGTIPIGRIRNKSLQNHGKKIYHRIRNSTKIIDADIPNGHEYAVAVLVSRKYYYGAQAAINVWKPKVEQPSEVSSSQIWVTTAEDEPVNTIEAGWIVDPELNGDYETRFFVFWEDHNKGCYNLRCPGFVQTNKKILINSIIKPPSTYNGQQHDITVTIFQDKKGRNWWVQILDELLGYWPASMFTSLANGSALIYWGGEIINKGSQVGGHHTRTEMGNGHFPSEGFGKSSYFRNLRVVDESNNLIDAVGVRAFASNVTCYDVHIQERKDTNYGYYFFYGGPGLSQICP